uniref:Uncharacterized protein n=1 Tax=Arion vulgaris TaxID=1028688 RepID=A0A0B7AJS7_9EUPU
MQRNVNCKIVTEMKGEKHVNIRIEDICFVDIFFPFYIFDVVTQLERQSISANFSCTAGLER